MPSVEDFPLIVMVELNGIPSFAEQCINVLMSYRLTWFLKRFINEDLSVARKSFSFSMNICLLSGVTLISIVERFAETLKAAKGA